jgi:hypothetical protein
MLKFKALQICVLAWFLAAAPCARAEATDASAGFLAVWRLMSNEQKQQFIAGYVQGWRDAGKVTDIAIQYVRDHPDKAIDGLEKVRALYDLHELSPGDVIPLIDAYYKHPENQNATFSSAVTAARQALQ